MECTFYRPDNFNLAEWRNIIDKLRQDLEELKYGKVTEEEAATYLRTLLYQAKPLRHDSSMWFFGLKEPEQMPGDARVDFFYWPTYIATGIIMTILTIYPKIYHSDRFIRETMPPEKAIFIINGCLRGCTGRNFNGFGYDDVHGKVEVMEFFTDVNIYAFHSKNRSFSREFMKCYGGALDSLKGRASGEWGDDYSERIDRIEKRSRMPV